MIMIKVTFARKYIFEEKTGRGGGVSKVFLGLSKPRFTVLCL